MHFCYTFLFLDFRFKNELTKKAFIDKLIDTQISDDFFFERNLNIENKIKNAESQLQFLFF